MESITKNLLLKFLNLQAQIGLSGEKIVETYVAISMSIIIFAVIIFKIHKVKNSTLLHLMIEDPLELHFRNSIVHQPRFVTS